MKSLLIVSFFLFSVLATAQGSFDSLSEINLGTLSDPTDPTSTFTKFLSFKELTGFPTISFGTDDTYKIQLTSPGVLYSTAGISANGLTSRIPAGAVPPIVVSSSAKVIYLNADLLDGYSSEDFLTTSTLVDASTLDGIDSLGFFILSAATPTVTGRPAFNGGTSGSTAPFTVDSTYKVTNLNADYLGGHQASNNTGDIPLSNGTTNANLNANLLQGFVTGNSTAQIPLSNGTVCTNLNADFLDTKSEAAFFSLADNETVSGIPAFNGGTSGSSSPFTVDSTQVVANLNADLFDGHNSDYYAVAGGAEDLSAYFKLDESETITGRPVFAGATISNFVPPFTLTGAYANTMVPNLNANFLNGISSAGFCASGTGDAGTLDTHDSTFFINGTSTAQTISTSLKVATPASALSGASFTIDSTQTASIQVPSGIAMYGYGQGNTSTDGFRITSSYHDYLGAEAPVLLWNKENSDVQIGSNNLLGLTVADDGVTVGVGTAGVDYTLAFNGESSDGTITYDEDNARFSFDQAIKTTGIFTLDNGAGNSVLTLADGLYGSTVRSTAGSSSGNLYLIPATGSDITVYGYTTGITEAAILLYDGSGYNTRVGGSGVNYFSNGSNVGIGDSTPDYKLDVAGTFGIDSYMDIASISKPASPAAGTIRLFVDTATGDLMVKNSAGTLVTVANF